MEAQSRSSTNPIPFAINDLPVRFHDPADSIRRGVRTTSATSFQTPVKPDKFPVVVDLRPKGETK
jgi:hypothetical protein